MERSRFPLPVSLKHLCEDMAEATGLQWDEPALAIYREDAPPSAVEQVDPFFESLGAWDRDTKTITVFQNRCVRCARNFGAPVSTVMRVVATHHIAHAVTQLGVHFVTGVTYIDVGNPAKRVRNEPASCRPQHPFCDDLIREEELYAQVCAYHYLHANNDREELRLFALLSAGHADIFSLAPERFVHQLARRDWKAAIDADPLAAMHDAAIIFGHLTRGVPVEKMEMVEENQ